MALDPGGAPYTTKQSLRSVLTNMLTTEQFAALEDELEICSADPSMDNKRRAVILQIGKMLDADWANALETVTRAIRAKREVLNEELRRFGERGDSDAALGLYEAAPGEYARAAISAYESTLE